MQVFAFTSQYGFVAAVAAWSILSGAALPAHDAVILGVEGLLGQRLVTFGTTETLFMPVSSFVAELLLEEEREMFTSGHAACAVQKLPQAATAPLFPQRWVGGTRRRSWRRTWCGSERTPACLRCEQTSSPRGPRDSKNS